MESNRMAKSPYKKRKIADPVAICFFCGVVFQSKITSYDQHLLRKHGIQYPTQNNNKFCLEKDCHKSFSRIEALRAHLSRAHNFQICSETLIFQAISDFESWKQKEESRSNCLWVKQGGSKNKMQYYYCNRSGYYRQQVPEEYRKRNLKKQGSCKLNNFCTSSLIVSCNRGDVIVQYCKTHYGHDAELVHIPLAKHEKESIADQLLQGVSPNVILDNIRSRENDHPHRIHLTTRKDIHNICNRYNIQVNEGSDVKNDAYQIIKRIKQCENAINEKLLRQVDNVDVLKTVESTMSKLSNYLDSKTGEVVETYELVLVNGIYTLQKT